MAGFCINSVEISSSVFTELVTYIFIYYKISMKIIYRNVSKKTIMTRETASAQHTWGHNTSTEKLPLLLSLYFQFWKEMHYLVYIIQQHFIIFIDERLTDN
jgi:hypothetical protein